MAVAQPDPELPDRNNLLVRIRLLVELAL